MLKMIYKVSLKDFMNNKSLYRNLPHIQKSNREEYDSPDIVFDIKPKLQTKLSHGHILVLDKSIKKIEENIYR